MRSTFSNRLKMGIHKTRGSGLSDGASALSSFIKAGAKIDLNTDPALPALEPRTLPNGVKNDPYLQRVSEDVVISGSDIAGVTTTDSLVNYATISKSNLTGYKYISTVPTGLLGTISLTGYQESLFATILQRDDVNNINKFSLQNGALTAFIVFVLPKTVTTLAQAQALLTGTVIRYELAAPIDRLNAPLLRNPKPARTLPNGVSNTPSTTKISEDKNLLLANLSGVALSVNANVASTTSNLFPDRNAWTDTVNGKVAFGDYSQVPDVTTDDIFYPNTFATRSDGRLKIGLPKTIVTVLDAYDYLKTIPIRYQLATPITEPFVNPVMDDAQPSQMGVMWGKVASPILSKTYVDDAINQYPFNAMKEITDSFGNVFVLMPKFYIAKQDGSGNKDRFVSQVKRAGYYLPQMFWDFTNNCELSYALIGKHLGSLSDDTTRLESKPNRYPANGLNIVQFRDKAKANGVGYQQLDIHGVDMLQALFYTMFGTINAQAVMQGYTQGQYSATHVATVTEANTNRVILANAFANLFAVGQSVSCGTTLGGNNVFKDRTIIAINVYDASNKAIVFDGAQANIAVGNILYNSGYKTGWSTPLLTGWAVANDGKSPCAFMGIESIFGDMWQFIDGININERQSWVCKNADSYASNLFAAPYEQLGYVNGAVDGYATEMGFDANFPFAEITKTASGGSATTFYSDYYYQSTGQRVAQLGGSWNRGSAAGLSCWSLYDSSSNINLVVGARLLKKPSKAESDLYAIENGIALDQPEYKSVPSNVLLKNIGTTATSGYKMVPVKGDSGALVSYQNLVTNGDFATLPVGGGNISMTSITIQNFVPGSLVFLVSGQYAGYQYSMGTRESLRNKRIYSSILVKATAVINTIAFVVGNDGIGQEVAYYSGSGNFERLSAIKKVDALASSGIVYSRPRDQRPSGWSNIEIKEFGSICLDDNPAVQALEASLGRQLTVAECDELFAFTPTSASIKVTCVPGLTLDGTDDYGTINL